jgi:N-acetyl sugar amidotransferase
MKKIIQCSQCLDDDKHPMGQIVDDSGLCTGCRTHKEKDLIDWGEKWAILQDKCSKILKNRSKADYDCIIPLNADAEDYYIVELALSLNLKPLLLYVNNYFGTDLSWKNLHTLETSFDLDLVTFNPNIHTYKEAIRTSLRKYNSIYWPYQALKTAYPVRLALDMDIPLILWGGLQATEQVGKFSHNDEVEMSNWSRNQHDLFAVDEMEFFGTGAQVSTVEQFQYSYPDLKKARKVTGIYLSNYVRWDPWKQNHDMLKYGFTPENSKYTFDQYERSGSSVFYSFHDLLRFEKYGYCKVRDQLSREIRHGRILKHNAEYVYNEYLNQSFDIKPFFDWIGATESGFKLFVREKIKYDLHKVSQSENSMVSIQSYFDTDYFSDNGTSIENFFIIYHKGI